MLRVKPLVVTTVLLGLLAAARPAAAQTTLTMSSWVSHRSAPPGTFDAVRDGLVDLSFVTASYTPARHILSLLPALPGGGDTALVNSVAYSRLHWKYVQKVGQGLKIRTGGGVADGVFFPLESIISFKLDTIAS
jgi:hypothetical protein